MKTFEYLVIETTASSPDQDEHWAKLGAEGWELVTAQSLQYAVTAMSPMEISLLKSRLIFKRDMTA